MRPHQRPPVDMLDIWNAMEYFKEHYNATVEITFDNRGDDAKYGLLCITVVAHCGHCEHPTTCAGWLAEPTVVMLCRMPEVLQAAMLALLEDIDGGCDACRRAADLVN